MFIFLWEVCVLYCYNNLPESIWIFLMTDKNICSNIVFTKLDNVKGYDDCSSGNPLSLHLQNK